MSKYRAMFQDTDRVIPAIVTPVARRGRPPAVSDEIIREATLIAERRDLMKNSCTSTSDVMEIVNELRHKKEEAAGRNPHAVLPEFCYTTQRKIALDVAPVNIKNGSIQNASRKRALRDPRNAISCASVWSAVSSEVKNGKFIHSWDEVGVMLNSFGEKQDLLCTNSGRKKLDARNMAPATTEKQEQCRMLKIGLSELQFLFI